MIIQPHNPGMMIEKIPDELFAKLKHEVMERKKETDPSLSYRKKVSQILSIKEVDDAPYVKEFDDYIQNFFKTWCQVFNVPCNNYEIQSVWVNYMKPGEFAPMHKHSPALASFVLWLKVPYNSTEEKKFHYNGIELDETNRNGAFEFLYSKYDGTTQLYRMDLDKNDEGKIFFFPGSLMHCVYPFFSSNEERISIAGNFYCLDQINKRLI